MTDENIRSTSTLDSELAHYTSLADTWWDPAGPFWPLHRLNELRIEWIIRKACETGNAAGDPLQPLAGLRVLDVGCGGGILSESLARAGASVRGIDVVARNIGIAQAHANRGGLPVDYALESAEDHAASGAQYDIVFNMEVVEHVADFPGFMATCAQMVRPGGLMFVATINRNPLAWLVAIIGAEYILRWLPKGTHHYHLLRKPREVRDALATHGYQVCAQSGVFVNPLTRRLSLVPSMLVNYMLCAKRIGTDA